MKQKRPSQLYFETASYFFTLQEVSLKKVINRYLVAYPYCLMVVFKGWLYWIYHAFICPFFSFLYSLIIGGFDK